MPNHPILPLKLHRWARLMNSMYTTIQTKKVRAIQNYDLKGQIPCLNILPFFRVKNSTSIITVFKTTKHTTYIINLFFRTFYWCSYHWHYYHRACYILNSTWDSRPSNPIMYHAWCISTKKILWPGNFIYLYIIIIMQRTLVLVLITMRVGFVHLVCSS